MLWYNRLVFFSSFKSDFSISINNAFSEAKCLNLKAYTRLSHAFHIATQLYVIILDLE